MFADEEIDIVDIAFPPHLQLEVVREAVRHKHIKGILTQKPLAMTYAEASEVVRLCEEAGIKLAVNQNMRFDQSIRSLKKLLDEGLLGDPVFATVEMRAIPHWQPFLRDYDRLTILNMSIHHLDSYRFLFGDPDRVMVSARPDPRTEFEHRDGIVTYTLEYDDTGLRAAGWDDVWAWPGEGTAPDIYIRWRVEGTKGMARGTIGWHEYPTRRPSTIDYTTRAQPDTWIQPRWSEVWFPDAFIGPMALLIDAVHENTDVPVVSGRDNLGTMALIDACYRALEERRSVEISEITA